MGKFTDILVGAAILKNVSDNRKQKKLGKEYEKQCKQNLKLSRKKAFLFEKDGMWHILHTDETGKNHLTTDKSEADVKDTFFVKHQFDPKTFEPAPKKYLRDFKLKTWARNAPVTYKPESSSGQTIVWIFVIVTILYQCAKEDEANKNLKNQKTPPVQIESPKKPDVNELPKPALENFKVEDNYNH